MPAVSAAAAQWIDAARSGRPGTVGSLVPGGFASTLRLSPPASDGDDWWDRYCELFSIVAAVGAAHTATPQDASFAIWEGHGFAPTTTRLMWRTPAVDATELQRRELLRAQQQRDDDERAATLGPALAAIPRLEFPDRTYYLLAGGLAAIGSLRYPGTDGWRNPDLFWPQDRSWFAATDVDIWSLYVAGPAAFTDELAARSPTDCELVDLDDALPIED